MEYYLPIGKKKPSILSLATHGWNYNNTYIQHLVLITTGALLNTHHLFKYQFSGLGNILF